jgi:hypothetical protein
MSLFKVTILGRGLWIELDAKVCRVGFRVTRFVDARDPHRAAAKAIALVGSDSKARELPGKSPPELSVEEVERVTRAPAVAPGFAFFPDPGPPVRRRKPSK